MTPLPDLKWVLCDHTGSPLPGSHIGQKRRLLFARNRAAEARISFSLHDEAAIAVFEALRNGIPQLRVYLGDTIVFSGHWTPMKGASVIDGESMVDSVFRDAFDRLAYRWTLNADETYPATDAGLIAVALIDDLNSDFYAGHSPLGATGVATDPAWVEPTMERDRTYNNKNVAEAIIELTEVIGGFDWFPTYLDPRDNAGRTMRFNVAASPAGTDRSDDVRFEYGIGTLENCQGYSFSTSLPVTLVRAMGAPGTSQTVGRLPVITRYGIYMAVVADPDVTVLSTLSEKASGGLRDSPAHVTDFNPDPELSPLPWRDFWIGDTVRWLCDDGAMQEQTDVIVQSLEVGIDDSDNIDDLVIGIDPEGAEKYIAPATSTRRYVHQQQDLRRRLAALEG